MTAQEYIESGSIESCVLGLATEAEMTEFERMCADYPEVSAARDQFEALLEQQAMAGAVTPPAPLRDQIWQKLQAEAPASTQAPVIPLTGASTSWKKYLVAASLILLAGSAALNVYLYNRYKSADQQYTDLLASQQQLASSNQSMQTRMESLQQDMSVMGNPEMKQVKLADVNKTNSQSTIFWNSQSKDVYLMVHHLPKPAAGKQYQLWAIVDGKPVDAGMVTLGDSPALLKMKTIASAQAFAITLEKEGGSPSPTLTAMYVMGKV